MDKIKARLKKLLTLADDGTASKGEVENAMRAARKLMAQHGLTRADLKDGEFGQHGIQAIGRQVTTWEKSAAYFIRSLVGYVEAYKKGNSIHFYGPEADVRTAIELYALLRDTIHATAMLLYGSYFRGDGALYAQGFMAGLAEAQRKSEAQLHSTDTALMVRDEKQQREVRDRATDWLEREQNVRMRASSRPAGARRGNPAAYHEGRRDGRNHKVA